MKKSLKALCAVSAAVALSSSASAALLVHYAFDEASSGASTALNTGTLGSAADGTFGGTATRSTTTPGGTGTSFSSNGGTADNYLTAGDVNTLEPLGNKFTLVTWINLQANPANGDGLIAKHISNSGFSWQFASPSTGTMSASNFRLDIAVTYGSGQYSANITSGEIGKWLFLALTYDWNPWPASRLYTTHYVGDLSTPVANAGTATHTSLGAPGANAADLRVGGTTRSTGDRTPYALFDDVRIYNEVLTQEQLEEIRTTMIPEPMSASFLALAGGGLMLSRRRSRSAAAS